MIIPKWFKHVIFLNGLPGVGKTLFLYHIFGIDHHQDLVLNLRYHNDIDGLRYTINYIDARGRNSLPAYQIPKYSLYAQNKFLKLFKLVHPQIKHVLIDEVERYHPKYLIRLCNNIHHFYQKVPIILAGVIKNDHNRSFPTSKFLLDHCRSKNINPKCKFCNRPASFMLNVWHHQPIHLSMINSLPSKSERKYIKRKIERIHVCKYHFVNPPKL